MAVIRCQGIWGKGAIRLCRFSGATICRPGDCCCEGVLASVTRLLPHEGSGVASCGPLARDHQRKIRMPVVCFTACTPYPGTVR